MSHMRSGRFVATALALLTGAAMCRSAVLPLHAQSDLDALMQQVLARRDDNWKKLQQYVLDEREEIEVRGPSRTPLWGERREFTWYLRDGFFVRSPLKFNGATIGEDDRRQYEADFLRRAQRRDRRGQRGEQPPVASEPDQAPGDVDGLIRQTREPQFISSAYFLRFRFDEGRYALVGRETLDGLDVLRIEYYPAKLFANRGKPNPREAEERRLMDKSSLVTLWVEPSSRQIIRYTLHNFGLEFLPVNWLVRVSDVTASMTMGQPFPGVWLPRDLEMHAEMTLALGSIDLRYTLGYHDYRQADVNSTLIVPEP